MNEPTKTTFLATQDQAGSWWMASAESNGRGGTNETLRSFYGRGASAKARAEAAALRMAATHCAGCGGSFIDDNAEAGRGMCEGCLADVEVYEQEQAECAAEYLAPGTHRR